MKKPVKHVVYNGNTSEFVCLRCGKTERVLLPMSVRHFVLHGNTFTRMHKHCIKMAVIEAEGVKP